MDADQGEKDRQGRVYAPGGRPPQRQNRVNQIATQFETKQPDVGPPEQQGRPAYRDSIVAWLGKPTPETCTVQDASDPGSTSMSEAKQPAKVSTVARKFEKNDEDLSDELVKYPRGLSRAAPSLSQHQYNQHGQASQPLVLPKNPSLESLDQHETTQFPLEAAKIPATDPIVQAIYTMHVSTAEASGTKSSSLSSRSSSPDSEASPNLGASPDPEATSRAQRHSDHVAAIWNKFEADERSRIRALNQSRALLHASVPIFNYSIEPVLNDPNTWGPSGPPPNFDPPYLPEAMRIAREKAFERQHRANWAILTAEQEALRQKAHEKMAKELEEFQEEFLGSEDQTMGEDDENDWEDEDV